MRAWFEQYNILLNLVVVLCNHQIGAYSIEHYQQQSILQYVFKRYILYALNLLLFLCFKQVVEDNVPTIAVHRNSSPCSV